MAPTQFSCGICPNTTFEGRKQLSSHIKSFHKKNKKTCPICSKVIVQRDISTGNFQRHLESHLATEERNEFKCSVVSCSKKYFTKSNLKRHVVSAHSVSVTSKIKFKCDQCSKEYSIRSALSKHVQQNQCGSVKKFGCNLCGATFASKSGRDIHIVAIHTGEKTFTCKKCPMKFSAASNLWSHQFSHTDARPITCKTCSKSFKRPEDLTKHLKTIHIQRTKNFRCSTCQKTFFTQGNLNHHSKTHNQGVVLFTCYFCSKGYKTRTEQEKHLRTHTQEKPIFCPQKSCQYSTAHSDCLKRHTRLHHSPNSGILPSKTWSCYFCTKAFNRFCHLVNHSRDHTLEEPFQCNMCPKSFKRATRLHLHIFIHTGEKPHGCSQCEKCFVRKRDLDFHLVKHTQVK